MQLSALDWADIVEQLSAVDAVLGAQSEFAALDFATRNRYRSAIEEIARDSQVRETEVAERAIAAAQLGRATAPAGREPGYYLIGPGRESLEAQVGYRAPWSLAVQRLMHRGGVSAYLLLVSLVTAAVLSVVAYGLRPLSSGHVAVLLALLLLPASDAVIAIVNSAITRLIKPAALPALDLAGVIPKEYRTLVAVPVLLSSHAEIEEAVANLESQYLASARGELYFALLADGVDADAAHTDADAELAAAGRRGIADLNARYARGARGRPLPVAAAGASLESRASSAGWAGSASAASCTNSTGCCAARATRRSSSPTEQHAALPGEVQYVLVLDA